jgi:caffeoyl-CoA O-methyltransferase
MIRAAAVGAWMLLVCLPVGVRAPRSVDGQRDLDGKIRTFLDAHRYGWRDLNIPEADGRALLDLVVKNGYTRAVEVGTSTGHSAIWTAWGLSRTGGKLITIEIDEGRHREAMKNFEDAGVAALIDARLGDAHQLVPRLTGPIDFVFLDADKDWYTKYAEALLPKLKVGGCLAAHNVSRSGGWRQVTGDFYAYVTGLPYMESGFTDSGLFYSYRRREK